MSQIEWNRHYYFNIILHGYNWTLYMTRMNLIEYRATIFLYPIDLTVVVVFVVFVVKLGPDM